MNEHELLINNIHEYVEDNMNGRRNSVHEEFDEHFGTNTPPHPTPTPPFLPTNTNVSGTR